MESEDMPEDTVFEKVMKENSEMVEKVSGLVDPLIERNADYIAEMVLHGGDPLEMSLIVSMNTCLAAIHILLNDQSR